MADFPVSPLLHASLCSLTRVTSTSVFPRHTPYHTGRGSGRPRLPVSPWGPCVSSEKQTHTDRYLNFNSHHPASAKRAAVRSLFDRARNITLRKEDLRKEHLTTTFRQNGYPLPFIRAISSSIQNHLHHQRSQIRNQTMKNARRKRRSSHWQ